MRPLDDLDELFRTQEEVKATLRTGFKDWRKFLDPDEGTIKKRIESDPKDTHSTCTGFCLYYLVTSKLLNPTGPAALKAQFSDDTVRHVLDNLGQAIRRGHNPTEKEKLETQARNTSTGPLPNQYNSAVEISGFLLAWKIFRNDKPIDEEVLTACRIGVKYIVGLVSKNGTVTRLGGGSVPNPYLTFWATVLLQEWLYLSTANGLGTSELSDESVKKALDTTTSWAESEMARGIAWCHAGVTSRFDIVELCYSTLTTVQFSFRTPESKQLANHALEILLNERNFSNGCFSPSAPVLADRDNYSLQVPTAEALALLLVADNELFEEHAEKLCQTFRWLKDHRLKDEGWYPEAEGRYGVPTAFMTTSVLVFLQGLESLLDKVLSQKALRALRVPSLPPDGNVKDIEYPGDLKEIFESQIIKPLKCEPRNTKLASFSMVLYGPPGTAKTTISKKLAHDLDWPLLIVNQSDFLNRGVDNIDSEADRIFHLASNLREVVILFDEVEELVTNRSGQQSDKLSRLLTTSMLPRIHHLRDRQRIVFIFATNYLQGIDAAAVRLGRFDIIRAVMPPKKDERHSMIEKLFESLEITEEVRKVLRRSKIVDRTDRFCFGDMRDLIRRIAILSQSGVTIDDDRFEAELKSSEKTVISKDDLKVFETSIQDKDRP